MDDLARLRRHPSELPDFLDCGMWSPPVREVRPKGVLGWLLRLTPISITEVDPTVEPATGAGDGPIRPHIDLDKDWEPLHFLLTGTALEGEEPACFLVRGGEELADDDLGYTSIRALTPEQVAAFDRHLASLTTDELARRFDVKRMVEMRIYSARRGKTRSNDEATLAHLLETFEALRTFVRETAGTGHGAIAHLS